MTVFIRVNTCFGCSKELYHRDGCFEYTPNIFWLRNRKNNFLLRTLICRNDELPLLTCISRVLFISLGSLGTNSKRSSKNTPKFHLIPAYWEKNSDLCGKITSTTRSISKFIFLIYFSIKITIKE